MPSNTNANLESKDLDGAPIDTARQRETEIACYSLDRDLARLVTLRIIPLDLAAAVRLLLQHATQHTHPYQFCDIP